MQLSLFFRIAFLSINKTETGCIGFDFYTKVATFHLLNPCKTSIPIHK